MPVHPTSPKDNLSREASGPLASENSPTAKFQSTQPRVFQKLQAAD